MSKIRLITASIRSASDSMSRGRGQSIVDRLGKRPIRVAAASRQATR